MKSALALSFVAGVLALAGVLWGGGNAAEAGSSDVTITNLWWDPWDPVENQPVTIHMTIANLGESTTSDFWVDFYNHEEDAPDPNQSGDAWCRITSMGPTSDKTCDVTTTWVAPVSYTFWIQVDTEQEVWESDETNNISGPNWVFVQADPDADAVGTPNDNCPSWPNHSQALPSWSAGVPLTGTGPDSDCDRFSDSREAYLGTDATKQCAANIGNENPDPWPVDTNDNRTANTIDVGQFVFVLNKTTAQAGSTRLDFNANGIINTLDVGAYVFVLNDSCSLAGP